MIERLRITNFQKHERLDLRLDPAVTVIVGESDAGKSAILRALRWLALNRPLGDGFIRDGCEGAAVRARADGVTVERAKGKAGNFYRVGDQTYEAFGAEVPPEVRKSLGLGEVNFQGQHDPAYWFCLSPGDVAKQLNRIVDLDDIDEVANRVAIMLRDQKLRKILVAKRLDENKRQLAEMNFVPLARKALDKAVGLQTSLREAKKKSSTLAGILEELKKAERRAAVRLPDLTRVERLRKEAEQEYNRLEGLQTLLQEIKQQERSTRGKRAELTRAAADLADRMEGHCPLCGREMNVSV